jgi:hypothetical protein
LYPKKILLWGNMSTLYLDSVQHMVLKVFLFANLGLCSALRAFEQGGIFIMPHLLRHGTSVYTVSSEKPAPTSHSGVRTPQLKDHQIFEPDALTTAPRGRL